MKGNIRKRLLAGVLASLMTLSLAACGSGGGETAEEETQSGSKWAYVPEYVSLPEEFNGYNCKILNDSIYYTDSVYNGEEGSSRSIVQYSLTEAQETARVLVGEGDGSISDFQVAEDGSLYVLDYTYSMTDEDYTSKNELVSLDPQGQENWRIDLSGIIGQENYVQGMAVDAEGRIYLLLDSKVVLLDETGAQKGEIELSPDSWIMGAGAGPDGRAYLCYYDGASMDSGTVLAVMDYDGRKLGEAYQNFPDNNSSGGLVSGGGDYDFLANDGGRLHGYRLDTQEDEVLLQWLDSNINGNYVESVGCLSDGRIVVVSRDWNTNEIEVALLTKTDASTLPEKQEIVVATYSASQELETQIVNFNKQSNQYHVTLRDYAHDVTDWTENTRQELITAINTDLTSGSNAPDIIDLSQVNVEEMASKGVFEDLTPYLEQSSVLNREDYLENILDAYTYGGTLVAIPFTFNLQTMAASSKELGAEQGWTLDEMIAYAEAHPDAELMEYADKSRALQTMFYMSQDAFIDWEQGTCSFDTDDFKKVLTFVAGFPDEYDWEADQRSTPEKIQAGDLLLEEVYLSEFRDIQVTRAMFEDQVNFIGYPTADGSAGCGFAASSAYAIVSRSEKKDGAWSFLEYYLNREAGGLFSWGFPSRKSDLDRLAEEAVQVEYMTDENGEQVLDEDGNPIEINNGGTMSYNDWMYEYHRPTQEEVEATRALIDSARPMSMVDDTILGIITEEAAPFFQGQKTVDDVAKVIQSRVQVYLDENQ